MGYPLAQDEPARLAALHELSILDTPPEPVYDDIVQLAAAICGTPMAIINFIDADRQWGKALVGLEDSEAPRDVSFCARTIVASDRTLVVPDALDDPSWMDNPMVTGDIGLRFYAGAAIVDEAGRALGSVCVADRRPRDLDDDKLEALRTLARQTAAHLAARRMAMQLAAANEQLRGLAIQDPLTGLPNRTLLFDRLTHALNARRRTGGDVGVLFCDLDGFKGVNDEFGHDVGDELLRLVAQRLLAAARTTDTVGRLAGDEFVVILPAVNGEHGMARATERVRDAVCRPGVARDVPLEPRISVGGVLAADGEDASAVLRRADEAMYRVKRS